MAKENTDEAYEPHRATAKILLDKFDTYTGSAKHWISTTRVKKPKAATAKSENAE